MSPGLRSGKRAQDMGAWGQAKLVSKAYSTQSLCLRKPSRELIVTRIQILRLNFRDFVAWERARNMHC